MKCILICLLFLQTTLSATSPTESLPEALTTYFDYLERYPKALAFCGRSEEGEIEILRDVETILDIQQKTGRKVGVIAEDHYWLWINDAVKFPNGKLGVYGRLLWRQSLTGPTGVAVMAILPNGKIALNRNFRHATRSWEYELPRGGVGKGETLEQAALREIEEETGMVIDQLQLLGQVATDSGVTNAVVPVFFAKVSAQYTARPEDSEAIASVDAFSVEELKKGFVDGFLCVTIDEQLCRIPLRDPFLAFALFQADLQRAYDQK